MLFKGTRRNAYPVYLFTAASAAFATRTMFLVTVLYHVEMVKMSPLQLVLVGTTLEIVVFISQVPTGIIADMYSRRASVIIGYLLMGTGFLLEGSIPRFETILLAQVLWGIGATCIDGAEEAWITDEIGEEQAGRVFTQASQIGQIASLVSIPVSISLASLQLNLPIIVGACMLLFLGVTLLFIMPEAHFQPAPREKRSSWQAMGKQIVDGSMAVRQSAMLFCILGVTFFLGLSSEGFDRLNQAHLVQSFTFPALGSLKPVVWFGIMSAVSMGLSIIVTEVIKRRVDMSKPRAVVGTLFALEILLFIGMISFGLVGNFYLALAAYWCIGTTRTASRPLYMTWLTQNSDSRVRATIFSVAGQVDAIGQIAGGPGVGYIGERISIRAALVSASLLLSPIFLFLIRALALSTSRAIETEKQDQQTTEVQVIPEK